MAYVTKEDGIRDFNSHDSAGYFKYIDSMVINSDFTLTRIPKDPNNPGILDLTSTWKMVPAYVNGYVDAFNLKYKKVSPSSYQVVESAKNNYPATSALGTIDKSTYIAVADNTAVVGTNKLLAVVDPTTGNITTPKHAAENMQAQITNSRDKSNFTYWLIGLVGALLIFWLYKRKKRR